MAAKMLISVDDDAASADDGGDDGVRVADKFCEGVSVVDAKVIVVSVFF